MKSRKESIFVCKYCGKEFISRSDSKAQYCDAKCYGRAMSEKQRKYAICPICGITFIKKRSTSKYCSNACSAKAKKKIKNVKCDNCGAQIERPQCHIKEHNFCSRECLNIWSKENRVAENSPRWNGGVYNTSKGYLFLRQNDGSYKAEHRIIVEQELGRKLESDEIVHHIDENKRNNSIDNLVVLSRSEHAKVHCTKLNK